MFGQLPLTRVLYRQFSWYQNCIALLLPALSNNFIHFSEKQDLQKAMMKATYLPFNLSSW